MNEEYLWSKTGRDEEIERLEGVLSVLRCEETETPGFSTARSNVVGFTRAKATNIFILAMAASILVAVGIGLWWAVPEAGRRSSEQAQHSAPDGVEPKPVVSDRSPDTGATVEIAAVRPERRTKPAIAVAKRKPRLSSRDAGTPRLTREEEYAYSQLLLALSITSSKLQVVRDTIDAGAESPASEGTK
jgi:hypothetical protein